MLNILFWNLRRNSIEDYVVECIVENDVGIAVFSEYSGIDFIKLEKKLGKMYDRIMLQKDSKVTLIAKTIISAKCLQEQDRYSIYFIQTAINNYLLVAVHLEDRRNYKTQDRIHTIEGLVATVGEIEKLWECSNTIVIGDFNANFYDEQL